MAIERHCGVMFTVLSLVWGLSGGSSLADAAADCEGHLANSWAQSATKSAWFVFDIEITDPTAVDVYVQTSREAGPASSAYWVIDKASNAVTASGVFVSRDAEEESAAIQVFGQGEAETLNGAPGDVGLGMSQTLDPGQYRVVELAAGSHVNESVGSLCADDATLLSQASGTETFFSSLSDFSSTTSAHVQGPFAIGASVGLGGVCTQLIHNQLFGWFGVAAGDVANLSYAGPESGRDRRQYDLVQSPPGAYSFEVESEVGAVDSAVFLIGADVPES